MRESQIQFSKPKKLLNSLNPGTHFMRTNIYDARELLTSVNPVRSLGGDANRPRMNFNEPPNVPPPFNNQYDPMNFITPGAASQSMASLPSLPVPMGMFMNMTHIPPRFYNNQQQPSRPPPTARQGNMRYKKNRPKANGPSSQNFLSQDTASQQGQGTPLTQGGLSQPGLSGGLSQNVFSQPELSQDNLTAEMQSQMDGMLSQDSTYEGERFASQTMGFLSQQ